MDERGNKNKIRIAIAAAGWLLIQVLGNDGMQNTLTSKGVDDEQWVMVKTKGNQFIVGDRPFYFNGFNSYALMVLAANPSTRGHVTEVLQQAAAVGRAHGVPDLGVQRWWLGGTPEVTLRLQRECLQVRLEWIILEVHPSKCHFHQRNGSIKGLLVSLLTYMQALDFVVSEARDYKIRVILPLVDNWSDGYGGKAQYVKWARDAGINVTSNKDGDDFFTAQTIKGYYKNHIKNMLTRVNTYMNVMYKDDPTIFAWELINEPQCRSDPTGNTVQAWIEEMALHVKSIDPDHLLEVGPEGYYGPSTPTRLQANPNTYSGQFGTDFIRNPATTAPTASTSPPSTCTRKYGCRMGHRWRCTSSLCSAHISDAEGVLGMPVVFTKFGFCSNSTPRDQFLQAVYGELLGSAQCSGAGAGNLLFQVILEELDGMDDCYAVVLTREAATAGIMSAHSKKLQIINNRPSEAGGANRRDEH
ncbi:hypothetical protein EJB05_34877, partial [Eragrostis curvula]